MVLITKPKESSHDLIASVEAGEMESSVFISYWGAYFGWHEIIDHVYIKDFSTPKSEHPIWAQGIISFAVPQAYADPFKQTKNL